MNKKSFILHVDSLDVLEELTNEQAGMLLKAMRAFHCGEELELDTLTKIVFSPFKNQFARDDVKYQKITDRNKVNGAKGGRPKGGGSNNHPEISSKGHFLYLIKDIYNDQFKIGETQNLKKRVYDIKRPTASLEVLHYWELDRQAAIDLERSFKKNFIEQTAGGDWFNSSDNFVTQAVNFIFEKTQWVSNNPKEPDSVNGSVNDNDSDNVNGIKEIKPRKLVAKRNTKIPDDFCITLKMREWSLLKKHHINIDEETENFKLYWKGCGKTKADWVATWQVWMNKNNKDTPPRQLSAQGYSKVTQQNLIEAEKWERSFDQ